MIERPRSIGASERAGTTLMPAAILPKRLAADRERHKIAAVLQEQEATSGAFAQHGEIVEREPADLHREVDDGCIDGGKNQQIEDGGRAANDK